MAGKNQKNTRATRAWFPITVGILALVLLIGGLGYWSVYARIAGAVVSSGMIQVETNRQIIQHPVGGVVGAILAKDGDFVDGGQTLIRLDGAQLRSELSIVEGQLFEIQARSARLEAERDDASKIVFPENLLELVKTKPAVKRQVIGETRLFEANQTALSQEFNLLGEQIAQIENRIDGTRAQIEALASQGELLAQERDNQETLLNRGLAQASRVMELRSQEASMKGQLGKLNADIAELRGQTAGYEIERVRLSTSRKQEAITNLRDLQFREIELAERRLSLNDTLSRLDIRAPVSGIVHGSEVFALQSVISPGAPIMYVIPQDQPLVIAARVDTINIDQVRIGQDASLRFTVFDQRTTPEIFGYVSRISADVIQDEITGLSFYAVELLPKTDELDKLGDEVLLPGMPVEAFIKTGDRSPLDYLTKPLTDYFARAFRE